MRVLALDTTTRSGSVAVAEDGRLLGSFQAGTGLDHAEHLLASVEALLGRLGLCGKDLAAVAATTGPGSFTGVRVGLASARGLARAWGLPAVGLSSLEALARTAVAPAGGWVCPWVDAGRGEIYAAAYVGAEFRVLLPPGLTVPEGWLADLPACPVTFVGDGAATHRASIEEQRGTGALAPGGPWFLAPALALWASAPAMGSGQERSSPLEPLYLRGSDAQTGRGRRR